MNTNVISTMAPPTGAATKQTRKKNTKGAKKKTPASTAPIFLRKTFTMIDSCDPSIAAWSDDGLSFLVKDTAVFASDVIPEYFKHSNFSSFVRQLNFYGFRKVKSDSIRIKDEENSADSKYWRFRHEKFQRDRPDLLAEIKKSNHNETADKQEVEHLKNEVDHLKGTISSMELEMQKLKHVVASLIQSQHPAPQPITSEPLRKKVKRERTIDPLDTLQMSDFDTQPIPVTSDGHVVNKQFNDVFHGDNLDNIYGFKNPVAPVSQGQPTNAFEIDSVTSSDEQILASVLALDSEEELIQENPNPNVAAHQPTQPSFELLG